MRGSSFPDDRFITVEIDFARMASVCRAVPVVRDASGWAPLRVAAASTAKMAVADKATRNWTALLLCIVLSPCVADNPGFVITPGKFDFNARRGLGATWTTAS